MNKRNTTLVCIDPQNDFCITNGPGGETGALVVAGAEADMNRLGQFIIKNQNRIDDVDITLDSHQYIHIAHPSFWVNSHGENPPPFTMITVDDVKNGVWRAFNPKWQGRALAYVTALAVNTPEHPRRYDLTIWPPHCLIGTWGHSIVPSVATAIYEWEKNTYNKTSFITKGSNIFTEHYSGVQADVPDDTDVSTKLNTSLITSLQEADEIIIAGEARSHCLCNTLRDIVKQFGNDNVKKITLLEDATSDVSGFEKLGREFVRDMVKLGMRVTTTKDW